MQDSFSKLPLEAAARIGSYLTSVDALLPGRVDAAWIEGSIALGDFQPRISDIDIVLVTRGQLPAPRELRRVHSGGRPRLAVDWLRWDSLATLGASGSLRVVTAATLHRYGIVVRGPHPATVVPDIDRAVLTDAMRSNLESYWVEWLRRARRNLVERLTTLHPRRIEWGVLGVPRQYVSIVEGDIVSKSAAGRYVRTRFDGRWARIVDEALRLRLGGPGANYASPFERRREMLAFLEYAIERTRKATFAPRSAAYSD